MKPRSCQSHPFRRRPAKGRAWLLVVLAALLPLGCAGAKNAGKTDPPPSPVVQPVKAVPAKDPTAPNHLALARELIGQGHYRVALVQLGQVEGKKGRQAEVAYLTGICHLESGDLQQAIKAFHNALDHDQDHAPAHNGMGLALARCGSMEKAVSWFQESFDLDPAKATTCNNLGYALLKMGKPDRAEPVLQRCLALAPAFETTGNNLAICQVLLGKDQQALELMLKYHPLERAYRNMAAVLIQRGDIGKAKEMEKRAEKIALESRQEP